MTHRGVEMRSMTRGPDEELDLDLVDKLVFAGQGLVLERFSHAETVTGRTPDFRVYRAGELVAYCEVKSPRDDWLDDKLAQAQPFEIVGGGRNDPTFNRIARHIEKAASQFDAVNPDRRFFNILAFVNHDEHSDFHDLVETVTGYFHTEDGSKIPTMTHISEGRIGRAKRGVDIVIWINARERRREGHMINDADPGRMEAVRKLLGLEAVEITA